MPSYVLSGASRSAGVTEERETSVHMKSNCAHLAWACCHPLGIQLACCKFIVVVAKERTLKSADLVRNIVMCCCPGWEHIRRKGFSHLQLSAGLLRPEHDAHFWLSQIGSKWTLSCDGLKICLCVAKKAQCS